MKRLTPSLFMLLLMFGSCKQNNIMPAPKAKTSNSDTVKNLVPVLVNADTALVIGEWKWSAQYAYGNSQLYTLNPANTGVQETLKLNGDNTWSQTKNGTVANTGTYSFPVVMTPAGWPVVFFSLVNHAVTDTARYDNFNFNTGFAGSYYASKDSLVFYGVYTVGSFTNLVSERVYVK